MARSLLVYSLALFLFGGWFSSARGAEAVEKPTEAQADEEYYELYKVFADTLDQVERNYVKEVSRRELMEAAIQGLLSKLDPYSNYISPEDITRFRTSVESQFGGIGIQVTLEGGQLKVISPLVGTPAYRAGIQAGDWIVEIDGKSTEGITLDQAVEKLQGQAGTSVKLTVVHEGSAKRETLSVEREVIQVATVLGDRRKSDDSWDFLYDPQHKIGYIRITAFSRDTARELEKAIEELQKQQFRGLILDLRFNPGGLLTSAIEVCDLFISEGLIVSTEGRNSPERKWEARKPGTYEDFPMVVLVNRYSASASEIVAACLQDHKRAVVIGERTWGKGSVQNVIELEGGRSALKLTTAGYQRPSGKKIHRFPEEKDADEWGVTPNDGFLVKLSDSELVALVTSRRQRDILKPQAERTDQQASSPDKAQPKTPPADETSRNDSEREGPGDGQPAAPPADAKPADKPGDKPADKPEANKADKPTHTADRQLQKALEHLIAELNKEQKDQ